VISLIKALFGRTGEQVGSQEAVRRINAGAVLVDVREPNEFAAGHASQALHLPLGRIRSEGSRAIDALGIPETTTEVLLVCQSGMRSRIAQRILSGDSRRRYTNVGGGMAAWSAAGFPITRRKR